MKLHWEVFEEIGVLKISGPVAETDLPVLKAGLKGILSSARPTLLVDRSAVENAVASFSTELLELQANSPNRKVIFLESGGTTVDAKLKQLRTSPDELTGTKTRLTAIVAEFKSRRDQAQSKLGASSGAADLPKLLGELSSSVRTQNDLKEMISPLRLAAAARAEIAPDPDQTQVAAVIKGAQDAILAKQGLT